MRGNKEIWLFRMIILLIIASCSGIAFADIVTGEIANSSGQLPVLKTSGHDFIGGKGANQMNDLILLLVDMGLNISYGDNGGTIFSMVDDSLTGIITDLSSGNSGGFMKIPLIRETMNYLDIAPADILVNSDEVSGSMEAIDSYNSRYGLIPNTT